MKVLLQATEILVMSLVIWAGLTLGLNWYWRNQTLPRVMIGNIEAGKQSLKDLKQSLKEAEKQCQQSQLVWQDKKMSLNSLRFNEEATIKEALKIGKGLAILSNLNRKIVIEPELDPVSWQELIKTAQAVFAEEGQKVQLRLINNKWVIINGKDGWQVDEPKLTTNLKKRLLVDSCPITVQVDLIKKRNQLTPEEMSNLEAKVKVLSKAQVSLKTANKEMVVLNGKDLVNFLITDPNKGQVGTLSKAKITTYLESLKLKFDTQPINARFKLSNHRVVEFSPAKSGYELKIQTNVERLMRELAQIDQPTNKTIELETKVIPPKITIKDSNNLGIVELLGRGESYYRHSIAGRVYNVELAARKIDGVLIAPGEEFSFNQAVGEISRATGFRSAYIIKDGRTILGDGGGVCQVSTTVFRAALKVGLPITERWAHAYRVGYYEQNSKPGFDATVFAPSKDLKFKNDTGSYILLHSWYETQKRHLIVDLYGQSDDRKSIIKNYQMWDIVPPPPPIYQDDPSLPKGVTKQVDWKAWGTKVKFDYLIEKNGKISFQKTFFSNYRPWQDVFLVGTKEN